VTTNVAFPLRGLKLGAYGSEEVTSAAGWTQPATKDRDRDASAAAAGPVYDLYAVINHFGSYTAGHYTATCRAPGAFLPWSAFSALECNLAALGSCLA
jgi:ubiquitin C-terminal hydrolase